MRHATTQEIPVVCTCGGQCVTADGYQCTGIVSFRVEHPLLARALYVSNACLPAAIREQESDAVIRRLGDDTV